RQLYYREWTPFETGRAGRSGRLQPRGKSAPSAGSASRAGVGNDMWGLWTSFRRAGVLSPNAVCRPQAALISSFDAVLLSRRTLRGTRHGPKILEWKVL